MIFPLTKLAVSAVLQPQPGTTPGSIQHQREMADQQSQLEANPDAAARGGAGRGQQSAGSTVNGGTSGPGATGSGTSSAAAKPPAPTGGAAKTGPSTPSNAGPSAKMPAPGASAAMKGAPTILTKRAFVFPLTKLAEVQTFKHPATPVPHRTDLTEDHTMGAGETLASQLVNSLHSQLTPRRSVLDPAISAPAHPLKHLA